MRNGTNPAVMLSDAKQLVAEAETPAGAALGLPVLVHGKGARAFDLDDVERALDACDE